MPLPFYIFAWIACAGYATQTVISKLTVKYSLPNPWLFNFLWNLFLLVLIAPVALYNGAGFPAHWINILLAGVCTALVGIFFILSLFRLDVSVLMPLFSFRAAFAVLLGVLVLHEAISRTQYFLIGIILVCGVLVSLDERLSLKAFFNKGVLIAMFLMVVLPLQALFINRAVADSGYWTTTMWALLIGQVFLLLTIPLFKTRFRNIKSKQYGAVLLVALAAFIATLANNKAFSMNISISSAILSVPLSMLFVVAFSIFKPDLFEKHTLKIYAVRFISAAIMIVAALKLG